MENTDCFSLPTSEDASWKQSHKEEKGREKHIHIHTKTDNAISELTLLSNLLDH